MKQILRLLAVSTALTGCAHSVAMMPERDLATRYAIADSAVRNTRIQRDEVSLARQVPGYAGEWFDGYGNFHVSLVELRDSSLIRPLIQARLANRSGSRQQSQPNLPKLVFDQARYDFRELLMYRQRLFDVYLKVPGAESLGIHQQSNSVIVGILNDSVAKGVKAYAKTLRIPSDAVDTRVEGVFCDLVGRYGLTINPIDSITGESLIEGSYLAARDGQYVDSARVPEGFDRHLSSFPLARERAGVYDVTVRKTGYQSWQKSGVKVDHDACGVLTVFLVARMIKNQ